MEEPRLEQQPEGLSLVWEDQVLRGDFRHLLSRVKAGRLGSELLVKAAKIKGQTSLKALDATAGMGEDSFLLAAAGFQVRLYERNPVVYALLEDALNRATQDAELAPITARMEARQENSVDAMAQLAGEFDVILLDPMFPQRQKSALVKKKLQMIQKLELPCADERELILAAIHARPRRLIVKRPPKGPWLGNCKPDYSIEGKAVRFDCYTEPYEKRHKYL